MATLKFYSTTAEKITINCPRFVTRIINGTITLFIKDLTPEAHKEIIDILFNNEVNFESYYMKNTTTFYAVEIKLSNMTELEITD